MVSFSQMIGLAVLHYHFDLPVVVVSVYDLHEADARGIAKRLGDQGKSRKALSFKAAVPCR